MKGLKQYAGDLIDEFRCSVGLALLDRVLRLLPLACSVREGILRGVVEQANYDRYSGYTLLCGKTPLPFEVWREQQRWLRTRPARSCKIHDTSRIHLVRESG